VEPLHALELEDYQALRVPVTLEHLDLAPACEVLAPVAGNGGWRLFSIFRIAGRAVIWTLTTAYTAITFVPFFLTLDAHSTTLLLVHTLCSGPLFQGAPEIIIVVGALFTKFLEVRDPRKFAIAQSFSGFLLSVERPYDVDLGSTQDRATERRE
jgi:hypothetical protein